MKFAEKVINRQAIFNGHVIDVELQEVQTVKGTLAKREIVHHAPAVALLVINDENKMVLEQQWRNPVAQVTWEIPAGKVDQRDDGSDFKAAVRELNEETRLQAKTIEKINSSYSSVGFCDELITLYLAKDLAPVANALPQDDDESIELTWVSLEQALKMVATGQIQDAKTIMAIYYWQSQTLKERLNEQSN